MIPPVSGRLVLRSFQTLCAPTAPAVVVLCAWASAAGCSEKPKGESPAASASTHGKADAVVDQNASVIELLARPTEFETRVVSHTWRADVFVSEGRLSGAGKDWGCSAKSKRSKSTRARFSHERRVPNMCRVLAPRPPSCRSTHRRAET